MYFIIGEPNSQKVRFIVETREDVGGWICIWQDDYFFISLLITIILLLNYITVLLITVMITILFVIKWIYFCSHSIIILISSLLEEIFAPKKMHCQIIELIFFFFLKLNSIRMGCKPFGIHQPIRTCHIRLLFKFIVKSIYPNAFNNISTNQKKTYFMFL